MSALSSPTDFRPRGSAMPPQLSRHRMEISMPPRPSILSFSQRAQKRFRWRIDRTYRPTERRLERGWYAPISDSGRSPVGTESRHALPAQVKPQAQSRPQWLARHLGQNAEPSDERRHQEGLRTLWTNMVTGADHRCPNERFDPALR